jgi:hypothetical protein
MNKEQQELLNEVYENYWNSNSDEEKTFQYEGHNIETRRMTKDEFVDMVKTDKEYGRRWGLKIEERELSLEERMDLIDKMHLRSYFGWQTWSVEEMEYRMNNDWNIPTRLITITYNDKTIESYEI